MVELEAIDYVYIDHFANTQTALQGTTLSHYRILEELGRGGMGIVFKAEDTKLERLVAIKVLPAAALSNEDDRARFYREAKAAASLNHPNIAAIHQIDEAIAVDAEGNQIEASDGPRPFIAMEYIEGGTLEDRIKQGPLKLADAVRIASEAASALNAAHANDIVHRDIKSANIMLSKDGQAKVLDFGLAQTAASTKLTKMGSTLGTVAYMSPEQARGDEVDSRTDLYSLGAVLYEMVTGQMPFGDSYEQAVVYSILNSEPEPLTALRTGVSMELERITAKLLAKDTARRYQTAADLIADLSHVDAPSLTSSIHTSRIVAPPATEPRRPSWHAPVAGVVLLLLGSLLTWLIMPGSPATPTPQVERLMLDMEGMRTIESVGISPDNRFIAMTGYDWDGNYGLFLYNVSEGTISHIERSEGAVYPWFSPSGTRLSFSGKGALDLYIMDVPFGTPSKIIGQSWTSYWMDEDRILMTHSGTFLDESTLLEQFDDRGANYIYSLAEDSAYVVSGTERAGDGAEWFFPGPRIPGSNLAIGNIQGSSAFGIESYLYIIDVEKVAATETEFSGINSQPLTKDILVYQLGDDSGKLVARRIDPETGAFRSPPVDLKEDVFFAHFQTEPYSGGLIFSADNLPDQQLVSVLNLDLGELSSYNVAGADGQIAGIQLSENGRELIANSRSGDTGLNRIISVDLETDRQVTRAEEVPYFGVERLGDGRMLVSRYSVENGLVLPGRQLVAENLATRQSADTLSGVHDRLSYTGTVTEGFIVTMAGEVGILENNGHDFTPFVSGRSQDVSSDGRYVSFVGSTGVMGIYNRGTGEVTELTGLRGSDPHFSTDGRFLYYFSYEDMPENVESEAVLVRIPIQLNGGFNVAGEAEFVLHVYYPRTMAVGNGRIAVFSSGDVSLTRPARKSARVGWWRNIGSELDAVLPR